MAADRYPEKQVCITGAAQSPPGRPSPFTPLRLTVDTALAAIADAGLKASDIDGLTTYPGPAMDAGGISPVGPTEAMLALGLNPLWVGASIDGHGHMGAFASAIHAIASGMCRHVVVYRTVGQATATRGASRHANLLGGRRGPGARVSAGHSMWTVPFNAVSPANLFALYAQAYFDKYGATSEQLGAIAVHSRKMAELNPNALFRTPLTLDDYMSSRVISAPLRLYDCDVPIDGSTVFVLSHKDAARDLGRPPIEIEAMGLSLGGIGAGLHLGDFTTMISDRSGDMLWSRTDLKPKDVDAAQIYDGFSIHTLLWLESLRLCPRGEAARFVEGGSRIALDGELPLNTGGGQLSGGRFHGFGHTYEACVQLWGRGGARQVKDAKVCAVANGGFGFGALLLKRA